jgi:hypothetical protein
MPALQQSGPPQQGGVQAEVVTRQIPHKDGLRTSSPLPEATPCRSTVVVLLLTNRDGVPCGCVAISRAVGAHADNNEARATADLAKLLRTVPAPLLLGVQVDDGSM